MILAYEETPTWSPWLVPGDVLRGRTDPTARAVVIAVDAGRSRFLVVQNRGARVEWCSFEFLDRLLQRREVAVHRSEGVPTSTSGRPVRAGRGRART